MISGPIDRRVVGTLLAALLAAGACVLEYLAVLIAMLTCFEACSERGGWRGDPDAWQWELQLAWATVGLLLAIASVPLVARSRGRRAVQALIASAIAFGTWWEFVTWGQG